MSKYKWQGEPVKVEIGNCAVRTNEEKPLWWYNFECYPSGKAFLPAIRITTKDGDSFMIANHFGIGVHKLINGGWPNYTHFSIDGSFSTGIIARITEFDLEGYKAHEAERVKWQQENYPEYWAKLQCLRDSVKQKKS